MMSASWGQSAHVWQATKWKQVAHVQISPMSRCSAWSVSQMLKSSASTVDDLPAGRTVGPTAGLRRQRPRALGESSGPVKGASLGFSLAAQSLESQLQEPEPQGLPSLR